MGIYNTKTSNKKIFLAHYSAITRIKQFPTGLVASSAGDGISVWDPSDDKWSLVRTYRGHDGGATSIEYLNSDTVISGSTDSSIHVWSISTGLLKLKIDLGRKYYCCPPLPYLPGWYETHPVCSLQMLSNGLLASGQEDGSIKIWNITMGNLTNTLTGHTNRVNDMSLVNEKLLASASADFTVKIWNYLNGSLISTLLGHTASVNALKVLSLLSSSSSFILASASYDTNILVWNLTTNTRVKMLSGLNDPIYNSLGLIRNSDTLMSASYNYVTKFGTVKLWKVPTGETMQTLTTDTALGDIYCLCILDGK